MGLEAVLLKMISALIQLYNANLKQEQMNQLLFWISNFIYTLVIFMMGLPFLGVKWPPVCTGKLGSC